MKLTGDEAEVQALKALSEKDGEYLKFLIRETRSNTGLCSRFKSPKGAVYLLEVDMKTGGSENV